MNVVNPQIACSISSINSSNEKLQLRDALRPHLLKSTYSNLTLELIFAHSEFNLRNLEQLIEAEKTCCTFLDYKLTERSDDITLQISGPLGSEVLLKNFFSGALNNDGNACECGTKSKASNSSLVKKGAGIISLCVVACAIPYVLLAIGVVSTSTAVFLNSGIEIAIFTTLIMGVSLFLFSKFLRRQ